MLNTVQRISFLLLMMLGIFILPWSLVFGMIAYSIARFRLFAEAILIGVALDTVSGMPFGFFTVIFAALILLSEIISNFFQEDNAFSVVGKSITLLSAFFILNMAGFIIFNWHTGVYFMRQFWYGGFIILFYGIFGLAIIFSLHFLASFIYRRIAISF
ncbi:MAG: hypothetical protein HZC14_02825 [Candidatus Niyogibacteria bacterium]|nr:hypothetical protein [Candidatus Niyogibacteria bacterium]